MFHQLKSKNKEEYHFVKYYLIHDVSIEDITKVLYEEFSKINLYTKVQPMQSTKVV